jgi:DNA primase
MPHAEVQITHPDRVLLPDSSAKKGITKGDLVDYYREVADTMGTQLAHGRVGGRTSMWCPRCQPE